MAGYVGYMWITYIDDTITVGSGYGFEIGSSKGEVIETLKKLYAEKEISTGFNYNRYIESQSEFQQLDFEVDIPLIYEKDLWKFYFGHANNTLKLYFEGEKLDEIHRHRQFFELP